MTNDRIICDETDFSALIRQISDVQDVLQGVAAHAVNLSLTARNWLIGFYIVEYEQHGKDRAQYGTNLLNSLSQRLNRKGMEARRLCEFRQFYLAYHRLGSQVGNYLHSNSLLLGSMNPDKKWRMPTAISQITDNENNEKLRLSTAKLEKLAKGVS